MRPPSPSSPPQPNRAIRPFIWLLLGVVSCPIIFLVGCAANGTPSMAGIESFFGAATPSPTPTPTAAPTSTPTPVAKETSRRPGRRAARQALAASENAAAAAKSAANASAEAAVASKQAATASKQAASVANQVEGTGPTSADVSLEANPGSTDAAVIPSTPAPRTSVASLAPATPAADTPTLSSPALDSSGSATDADPSKAAKMIQDIDKIEKRVDRTNLSADDSQRDILAQKLLQEAKKALADRDSVAAMSLATKASTLLAPLPKLADSAIPPSP